MHLQECMTWTCINDIQLFRTHWLCFCELFKSLWFYIALTKWLLRMTTHLPLRKSKRIFDVKDNPGSTRSVYYIHWKCQPDWKFPWYVLHSTLYSWDFYILFLHPFKTDTCPGCWQAVWYSAFWHRSLTRWYLGRKFSSWATSFPSALLCRGFLCERERIAWKLIQPTILQREYCHKVTMLGMKTYSAKRSINKPYPLSTRKESLHVLPFLFNWNLKMSKKGEKYCQTRLWYLDWTNMHHIFKCHLCSALKRN